MINFEFNAERDGVSIDVTIMGGLTRTLSIEEAEQLEAQLLDAIHLLRYRIECAEDVEDAMLNRGWGED